MVCVGTDVSRSGLGFRSERRLNTKALQAGEMNQRAQERAGSNPNFRYLKTGA